MKDLKTALLTMMSALIMYVLVMYIIAPAFINSMLKVWIASDVELLRLLLAIGIVVGIFLSALVHKIKTILEPPPLNCMYGLVVHPDERRDGSFIDDRRYKDFIESGKNPIVLSAGVFTTQSEWKTLTYAYAFTDAAAEYLKDMLTEGIRSNLKKTAHNSVQKGI